MKKTKITTKTKLKILAGIIAAVFIAVNLVWFIGVGIPYYNYTKNMVASEDDFGRYVYTDDKYEYYVKAAKYLHFDSGFLRVEKIGGQKLIYENDKWVLGDKNFISLYIWPAFNNSEIKLGVVIESDNSDEGGQIVLDENLNPILLESDPETELVYKNILNKNSERISEMLSRAKAFWNIK